jgi:hypothetical protein
MKNTINDKAKLPDKIESDDKEKIDATLKEALEWLDENQSAVKEVHVGSLDFHHVCCIDLCAGTVVEEIENDTEYSHEGHGNCYLSRKLS